MNKSDSLLSKDLFLLYQEFSEIRKIKQDTVFQSRRFKLVQDIKIKKNMYEQDIHYHYLSCQKFQISFNHDSIFYLRNKNYFDVLKKLKIGKYVPEIILDVHGLNQDQAKRKLGELLNICHKENLFCASVIHGHGRNILKNKIPIWLSRHPSVIAFYKIPKKFGRSTAILFLIHSSD
ncbi:hypothetical protein bbp_092 [Buchnera aphidicola str. Bp (Baizongia pistaciae)]|uniref:Ribosome rescue factor SmrB n=1 Tax=Buchnera aphidicola subsp. Baizongia pistaciae (strain Bp) TaxID=224915 RepID=SMRB_BUCBP|nr:endonuclease SmrB [Buchnera aphidicola]Q89AX8.1 RecName: Full=UPF0115 protein bbp_092 [Buchnera aphidicola str. Bp (Baizongia pistaciae)]AAO26827.1 hypothetical protein bbp_092 [Buchnera aphidicola str. Bp (Baizongia pistaciae)]